MKKIILSILIAILLVLIAFSCEPAFSQEPTTAKVIARIITTPVQIGLTNDSTIYFTPNVQISDTVLSNIHILVLHCE